MSQVSKDLPAFIAGDWGTSNLRLALCDAQGQALDVRKGPGAAESRGKHAEIFDELCADWRRAHGELPAVLSGMVGSTIGWLEVPYLPCPAELYELAENPARVRDGVFIVSGMRCSNPLGAPDVMRGEETQLLGARYLDASLEDGSAARLHAGHPHQVGVAAQGRGAGIPDRAYRRAVRHAVRAQRAGARQGDAHRPPARGFRAWARRVSPSSGSEPAAPAVPEPQPAHRQAAQRGRRRIVDVRVAHRLGRRAARWPCSRTCHARHRSTSSARRNSTNPMPARSRATAARPYASRATRPRSPGSPSSISSWSARNHEPEHRHRTRGHPARADAGARAGSRRCARGLRLPHHRSAAELSRSVRHHQTTGPGARRFVPHRCRHGADARRGR